MANYGSFATWLAALGGTYSRASAASYYNSIGVLTQAASGELRYDYDPVTLAPKGILLEGARTNLCTYSAQFSSWTPNNGLSVTSDSTLSPSSTLTADTLIDANASNYSSARETFVVANDSSTYTLSIFIKKTSGASSFPGLNITMSGGTTVYASAAVNTDTGVLTSRTGEAPAYKSAVDCGSYWRVSISGTNNSSGNTSLLVGIFPAVNNDAGASWVASTQGSTIVWGAQLEAGSFASSYIPTTSSSATRAADSLTFPTSPWFNASEGTVFAKGKSISSAVSGFPWTVSNSGSYSAGAFLRLYNASPDTAYIGGGYSPGVLKSAGSAALGYKACVAYAGANEDIAVNGLSVETNASNDFVGGATIFTVSGVGTSYAIFGWIEQIGYWPFRVTDAELQRLTT